MTKNGQNMAKMEKIRNMQIVDNKKDKFFCFPMISVACTGSGYKKRAKYLRIKYLALFFFCIYVPKLFPNILLQITKESSKL